MWDTLIFRKYPKHRRREFLLLRRWWMYADHSRKTRKRSARCRRKVTFARMRSAALRVRLLRYALAWNLQNIEKSVDRVCRIHSFCIAVICQSLRCTDCFQRCMPRSIPLLFIRSTARANTRRWCLINRTKLHRVAKVRCNCLFRHRLNAMFTTFRCRRMVVINDFHRRRRNAVNAELDRRRNDSLNLSTSFDRATMCFQRLCAPILATFVLVFANIKTALDLSACNCTTSCHWQNPTATAARRRRVIPRASKARWRRRLVVCTRNTLSQ